MFCFKETITTLTKRNNNFLSSEKDEKISIGVLGGGGRLPQRDVEVVEPFCYF